MRMPILSYFLVIGPVLFGGLILVSSQLESKPLPVSQRIGVPPPFKALPDEIQSQTGSVDSADESNVRIRSYSPSHRSKMSDLIVRPSGQPPTEFRHSLQ